MSVGEIFFKVGIAAVILSVLLGIAALVLFKILRSGLYRQLDQEYGPRDKGGEIPARPGPDQNPSGPRYQVGKGETDSAGATQIIGAVYEVIKKLGAGGGGVVYLANHTQLKKQVVLKADKRTLSTRPDLLRREVDVLKNLRHPYIPQVYGFFTENETVYTAMDYVDGESLDRPLREGKRFSQPQIIRWAKQLLQALDYLHSPTHGEPPRGYVHSDIKPANLMCRLNGDICLIDFNISLALGELNVIGASEGYASPEHYGLDFSYSSTTITQSDNTPLAGEETLTLTVSASRSTVPQKMIVPDIRSDVYSAGATLYHLLSGRRPVKDARQNPPLNPGEASGQVAAIIAKAMNPNPDLRYQTAAEMLCAFERLHENDIRARRLNRRIRITAVALAFTFFFGGICAFSGLRKMQRAEEEARLVETEARLAEEKARLEAEAKQEEERVRAEAERKANLALKAVRDSESAYQSGNIPSAVQAALEALSEPTQYQGEAQRALTDALGVYDLSGGFKSHLLLELPSELLKLTLSPEGSRAGVIVSGQALVFDTESGTRLADLPADLSALSDIVFLGEDTVYYAGVGGLRAYDLTEGRELWSGEPATAITLSSDGSTVAAVYQDEGFAVIYDAVTGAEKQRVDFEGRHLDVTKNDIAMDPERDLFKLNGDGTLLAVSFAGGEMQVFDLRNRDNDLIFYEESDFYRFEGGFCGPYFAFSAMSGEGSEVAVFDVDTLEVLWAGTSKRAYHMQVDEDGVYAGQSNFIVSLDMAEGMQTEIATTDGDIIAYQVDNKSGRIAAATSDGTLTFFDGSRLNGLTTPCGLIGTAGVYAAAGDTDTPFLRIFKLETHPEMQVLAYDADYPHDEARLSADENIFMLFRFDQFRIYDRMGTILADVSLDVPEGDRVYDQQFRRDGDESWLEVIFYSGLVRHYSAKDGTLLSETTGTPPDESLHETFLTGRLRIECPLHGTPTAYDRETGETVGELEAEDYLTYVTQAGEWIITEYMTGKGERYGLLLNDNLEVLARLPGLCDITPDGGLLFDDMAGTLRQSRIYSLRELTALAEQ